MLSRRPTAHLPGPDLCHHALLLLSGIHVAWHQQHKVPSAVTLIADMKHTGHGFRSGWQSYAAMSWHITAKSGPWHNAPGSSQTPHLQKCDQGCCPHMDPVDHLRIKPACAAHHTKASPRLPQASKGVEDIVYTAAGTLRPSDFLHHTILPR